MFNESIVGYRIRVLPFMLLSFGVIFGVFFYGSLDSMTHTNEAGVNLGYESFNLLAYCVYGLGAIIIFQFLLDIIFIIFFESVGVRYD